MDTAYWMYSPEDKKRVTFIVAFYFIYSLSRFKSHSAYVHHGRSQLDINMSFHKNVLRTLYPGSISFDDLILFHT